MATEDVLEDRRLTGDWWWVTRDWNSPVYHLKRDRDSTGIKNDVLHSKSVQHVIDELATETGRDRNEFMMDASEVLDQMGHMFTMKAIRFFGLLLSKTMKRIYRSINVNVAGIESVRQLVPRYPILLMPTHRSYVDFLIVSYVFYHYDLPLPVIASGQDFISMKVMGRLMRHAGAFFIRRSFGGDRLYWCLFMEYIRTHVANGDAPLEFFVEGTRSRSGKSLFPKLGLLTAALEPFFKSDVLDIFVVPIAISYDRTLEETLYAYEVLGVPKPKESTSGLFRARRILGDDYGNVHMNIGEPISVRQFCGTRIERSVHNCCPKHLSPLTVKEHAVVKELAYYVLDCHRKTVKLSPFVLIAATLVGHMGHGTREIPLKQLTTDVSWLHSIVSQLGANINWDFDPSVIIREEFKVHRNVVCITGEEEKLVRVLEASSAPSVDYSVVPKELQGVVVSHLLLSHYSNHILNVFVPHGLLALILVTKSQTADFVTLEWIRTEYSFLQTLLQFEFAFYHSHSMQVFDRALSFLVDVGVVSLNTCNNVVTATSGDKLLDFFVSMFEPFLLAYWLLCSSLLESVPTTPLPSKVISKQAQVAAASFLVSNSEIHQFGILSLELLSNGVNALHGFGALEKDSTNGLSSYRVVRQKLLPIAARLDAYVRKCSSDESSGSRQSSFEKWKAKL